MAIYRFEAKVIARSQGRSATASAAYRAGESIDDERTGIVFDYTRKRGVLYADIITPPNTPDWMKDRAQLWNAVEKVEKRKDAQLARDLLLSLPHELTQEQRRYLVREFVTTEFVAQGMIADVAIHAPDRQGDDRNYHAHVLLTMRELVPNGFGYKVREWNATEQLETWRKHWADTVNSHLEKYGYEARVDHRSLADQGIDREPEPKQGPVATEMEREDRPSHAGDDRRAAKARNEARAALRAEWNSVTAEIFDLEQERAKQAGQENMSKIPLDERTEEQRWIRAQQDEEMRQMQAREEEQRRQQEFRQTEDQRIEALARENADIQVRQAEEMREQRARLDEFDDTQKRQAEEARQEESKRQAKEQDKADEREVRNAGDRYRIALGQEYDIREPYGSLARAAMAEYGAFIRDREQLTRQIAQEQDAEARKALELRKEIEANDYIAITSRRIAGQSEIITGRHNSEEAVRFRERAAEYEAQSKELRQEYRDLATERAARAADPQELQQHEAPAQNSQSSQPAENSAAKEAEAPGQEPEKGEITDAKAARIAQIEEQSRQFEEAEKARQNSQNLDRGGRSM